MRHLKFCSCWCCRAGRHKAGSKCVIRRVVRRFRRESKLALRRGCEPPGVMSVPYTD